MDAVQAEPGGALGRPRALSAAQTLAYGAGNAGAGAMFGLANAVLPLYLAEYGFSNAAIGLLAQDRPPLAGLSQIIIGWLSDRTASRWGRRRPYMLAGAPLAAAAVLVLALRPPVWLMVAMLLLATTALAAAYGPYLALLRDRVPEHQRGRVGAFQALAGMLGQLGLLYLAAQLWEDHPGLVFLGVAAALLAGFAVAASGVDEPLEPAARTPAPARGARQRQAWRRLADHLRDLLSYREAAKYLLPTLCFWLGTGGTVPFLTRFGVQELGLDERTAFQLLMVAMVATMLGAVPAGWLGDRYGKKPVLLAGLGMLGLTVLVSSQVRSVEQAVLALVATGAANGVCAALLFPLLADLIPRQRAGELTGLGTAVWELAQPLGALLGGLSADLTGSLRTTLVGAGLLLLLASALLAPVHPERAFATEDVERER